MGMQIRFEDHSDEVLRDLREAVSRILEMWGMAIEGWAKRLCPVGTVESTGKKGYRGGTLRNSITHEVNEGDQTVDIGSNVEYAPYVELGTGPYFEPPPDWEQFDAERGSGIGHGYVSARPFLRPAVENNQEKLRKIMEQELKK